MPHKEKGKTKAHPHKVGTAVKKTLDKSLDPIQDEQGYRSVMASMNALMNKGSERLSKDEISELGQLASLVENYEEAKFPAAPIKTLAGLIDQKMYDMRLSQGAMARLLGVSEAKLSLILHGKQKVDVQLLKTIYHKLKIDAIVLMNLI